MQAEPKRIVSKTQILGVIASCSFLFVGCSDEGDTLVQMSDSSSLIAASSAQEWVALSEYVAVVTVENEKVERPDVPGEGHSDSGLSFYSVVIDRVVWEDPDAESVEPGATVEIFGAGWVFGSDGERPFFPHLEIGERYLMPLGRFGADGLGPLTFESIIPVDEDGTLRDWTVRVGDGESVMVPSIPGPLAGELPDAPTVDDVERVLGSLEVPTELRRASESPIDRYSALQAQAG